MAAISRTPRGVRGLKSKTEYSVPQVTASHPSRGAWIEIAPFSSFTQRGWVAPLAGCVD